MNFRGTYKVHMDQSLVVHLLVGRHPTSELYITGTRQILVGVHAENDGCHEYNCPIHNPSAFAEAIGHTHYRNDRQMMERICEHGVGHPDPDAQDWRERTFGDRDDVHGCDGCCRKRPAAPERQFNDDGTEF